MSQKVTDDTRYACMTSFLIVDLTDPDISMISEVLEIRTDQIRQRSRLKPKKEAKIVGCLPRRQISQNKLPPCI